MAGRNVLGHKENRVLCEFAEGLGYTYDCTRKNHLRFRHPNGATVVTSGTPSDVKLFPQVRARLRLGARCSAAE